MMESANNSLFFMLHTHSAAKGLALEIDRHIILTRAEYNALLTKTIS